MTAPAAAWDVFLPSGGGQWHLKEVVLLDLGSGRVQQLEEDPRVEWFSVIDLPDRVLMRAEFARDRVWIAVADAGLQELKIGARGAEQAPEGKTRRGKKSSPEPGEEELGKGAAGGGKGKTAGRRRRGRTARSRGRSGGRSRWSGRRR